MKRICLSTRTGHASYACLLYGTDSMIRDIAIIQKIGPAKAPRDGPTIWLKSYEFEETGVGLKGLLNSTAQFGSMNCHDVSVPNY